MARQLAPLLLALALPLRTVAAHPRLVHAVPTAASHLTVAPRELALTFNEAVSVALSRLSLLDARHQPVRLGAVHAAPGDARTLMASVLGSLSPGSYTVKWQAGGPDGHPIRGEYEFVVGTSADGRATDTTTAPVVQRQAPTAAAFGSESPVYVGIRAVLSIALVMLLGLLALKAVILPRFARRASASWPTTGEALERASTWWARTMLWVIGAATVARLIAQHAAFFGPEKPWTRSSMAALLLHSIWGLGWWLALAATAVGLWGTRPMHRARPQRWPALAASAFALAASLAMSGHAAATTLAIFIQTLHVLAAGGWIGSLSALVFLALPTTLRLGDRDRHEHVAGLVRAFSPMALGSAGLLAITGLTAAWRNLGSLSGLWHAPYGQVLLLKLALVSVAAGTGAFNWKRVLPHLGSDFATDRLRKSATVELAAAFLVLVVTAVLVGTSMPGEMLDTTVR